LKLNDKQITIFLLAIQGVGAVFAGIFLAAYLGGMLMTPSTTVLHSEPAFRIPLMVFGIVLLFLVLVAVLMAIFSKKSKSYHGNADA
jgi:Na+-transporting methylmalonyl-CoA/oxaloacetate decarboxylase gamma subunit